MPDIVISAGVPSVAVPNVTYVAAEGGGERGVWIYIRRENSSNCCRNEYVMVSDIPRGRRHMRHLRGPAQHSRSVVLAGEAADAEDCPRQ